MFLEAISWGRLKDLKGKGNPTKYAVCLRLGTWHKREVYVLAFFHVWLEMHGTPVIYKDFLLLKTAHILKQNVKFF